jgi:hypothetical protein
MNSKDDFNASLQVKQKTCSACGAAFGCGATEENGSCWCSHLPPLFKPDEEVDCLCPACLKEATIKKIDEYVSSLTPSEALRNKAMHLPKSHHLEEGIDYYISEGLLVFTAWYHLKRGSCCQNGCRHCPYGFNQS